MAGRGRPAILALLAAVAVAALFARVALFNLTTGVVGGDIDGYINVWDNWWLKTALFDLHRNPFFTDYLYYPTGISLYFHTFNPINALLNMPLNLLIGYVPAINLLFVALLATTTFCAFLFIRDLVGDPWAAFAGAVLYTYGHHLVVEYFTAGQTERLSAEWFPLYLFCLYRALYGVPRRDAAGAELPKDPRRWPLWAGLAVLTLLAMSLADWQYVMVTIFATLLLFAFTLLTRRPAREKAVIFGKLAAIGGLYAVLITPPLLWPTIQYALANPWLSVGYQSGLHAADLLDLLGPGPANPGYLALGAALLGLGIAGRGRAGEPVRFWALAAGAFYLMALGPMLIVGGHQTGIPLPYSLLQNLPVFSIGRDPARYTLVARLGVGVLAAYGLRALFAWQPRRTSSPPAPLRAEGGPARRLPRFLLPVAVPVFLALNLGGFFVAAGAAHADPPDWPPFYRQIAADPASYALVELPLFTEKGRGEDHYEMYQLLHLKPRFGGHYARDRKLTNPDNFVKHASLFRDLWLLDFPPSDRAELYPARDFLRRTDYATQGLAILNYFHAGYLVLYKEALYPGWDEAAFQRIIGQVLGAGVQPTYEDRLMRVYRVPPGPPAANPLTLDVGDGWFGPEKKTDGTVFRWADNADDQDSEFYTMNLTQAPLRATLHFTVYTWQQARTLRFAVNGTPVATLQLKPEEGEHAAAVALTLPPGNNRITISTPEAPLPTGQPHDSRLLSFGMYGVSLEGQ